MRWLLLAVIRAYQRYLSPYKGFGCAYRVHTGRASCSALGYRAVRRHGVFTGLCLIRRRTSLCGVAHRRHVAAPPPLQAQRGVCDLGCDLPDAGGCDLPGGRHLGALADALGCCDACNCDWPRREPRPRDRAREQQTYLPPRRRNAR